MASKSRFNVLAATLAKRHGVQNPQALAAWIGRKKYGSAGFRTLARHQDGQPIHGHRRLTHQAAEPTYLPPDKLSNYPQGFHARSKR